MVTYPPHVISINRLTQISLLNAPTLLVEQENVEM